MNSYEILKVLRIHMLNSPSNTPFKHSIGDMSPLTIWWKDGKATKKKKNN